MPPAAPPVKIDGVMTAGGSAWWPRAIRISTKASVVAYTGWQEYAISDGTGANKLPADFAHPRMLWACWACQATAAYAGLTDIGQPRPGETVVVAAATGAVGSLVGQIAKLRGCHVVGIAGGAQKCESAVQELADACIDHRAVDFAAQQAACPRGIDVYFETSAVPCSTR
jgi:NADPH-dependent curcumin reductase CurA